MLRKIFGAAFVLAAAALVGPVALAASPPKMHQCEDCANLDDVQRVTLGYARVNCTEPDFHVFSLKNGLIQRAGATPGYPCGPSPNPRVLLLENQSQFEDAFAHMLNAEESLPGVFRFQQVIIGDIGAIGPGHDPVAIAAGGQHGQAFGSFDQSMRRCFSEIPCVRNISGTLASLVGANSALSGLNLSILGFGAGVNWENVPPNHQIWLCNGNSDCALIKFENGEWKYIESRSEGGRGIRYPQPNEELTYQFNNSESAMMAERGFREAGYSVRGGWTFRSILACSNVSGASRCEYFIVPR